LFELFIIVADGHGETEQLFEGLIRLGKLNGDVTGGNAHWRAHLADHRGVSFRLNCFVSGGVLSMAAENSNGNGKPTIDQRLEALAQSVELLTRDIHEMQTEFSRLDARERKARLSLLAGIQAYLKAMNEPEQGREG
jgi:hypothetical protein